MGVIVPLIALGLTYGVARREVAVFERHAAADIAAQLQGEHKRVQVKTQFELPFSPLFADIKRGTIAASHFETNGLPLFTDPERPRTGRVRNLEIILHDFTLKGLRIESLRSSIPECRFDRDLALKKRQIRLSKSGIGQGEVRILEQDLARYIPTKVKEIKECLVKLDRGKVWVEGYGEFLIAKTRFLVVADLQIEDGVRLNLTNARVVLDWQMADDLSRKALLDAMNPVVDLQKDLGLLDAFLLESVTCQGGALIAKGQTKIPIRPQNPPLTREGG